MQVVPNWAKLLRWVSHLERVSRVKTCISSFNNQGTFCTATAFLVPSSSPPLNIYCGTSWKRSFHPPFPWYWYKDSFTSTQILPFPQWPWKHNIHLSLSLTVSLDFKPGKSMSYKLKWSIQLGKQSETKGRKREMCFLSQSLKNRLGTQGEKTKQETRFYI